MSIWSVIKVDITCFLHAQHHSVHLYIFYIHVQIPVFIWNWQGQSYPSDLGFFFVFLFIFRFIKGVGVSYICSAHFMSSNLISQFVIKLFDMYETKWMQTATPEASDSSLPCIHPQYIVLSKIPCYISQFATSSNN